MTKRGLYDLDVSKLESDLISEIKLDPLQAKAYILINCRGRMSSAAIAQNLKITDESAAKIASALIDLGAFIDMPNDEFEAMHPRFTAVNMYRRYCQRENIEFKRNKIVDNIGTVLEGPYDDARTGHLSGNSL